MTPTSENVRHLFNEIKYFEESMRVRVRALHVSSVFLCVFPKQITEAWLMQACKGSLGVFACFLSVVESNDTIMLILG